MCTVSVITAVDALGARTLRMVVNRDEQRTRTPAQPPEWRRLPTGERGLFPLDPDGGGTWVGASEHGLALCLMNLTRPGVLAPLAGALSRGLIIPRLLNSPSAAAAVERLEQMDLSPFPGFRLLAVGPIGASGSARLFESAWDRASLEVRTHELQFNGVSTHTRGVCFASSGLGDALVQSRVGLFEQMVLAGSGDASAQDRFHDHRWTERGSESVRMSRPDARTVSVTVVTVTGSPADGSNSASPRVHMSYQPVPEDVPAGQGEASAARGKGRFA